MFSHRAGVISIRDSLIRWAVFVLLFGFLINSYGGGVSNSAHIGGLAGGLLFGVLPEPGLRPERVGHRAWAAAGWLSAAIWIVTIAFMIKSVIIEWPQIHTQ